MDEHLPRFCDITIFSLLTRYGHPRSGTSNRGGVLLEAATKDNDDTYEPVETSEFGKVYCLGHEVFGRLSHQSVSLLWKLSRERTREMSERLRRKVGHVRL